jgi:hypothetical protein
MFSSVLASFGGDPNIPGFKAALRFKFAKHVAWNDNSAMVQL